MTYAREPAEGQLPEIERVTGRAGCRAQTRLFGSGTEMVQNEHSEGRLTEPPFTQNPEFALRVANVVPIQALRCNRQVLGSFEFLPVERHPAGSSRIWDSDVPERTVQGACGGLVSRLAGGSGGDRNRISSPREGGSRSSIRDWVGLLRTETQGSCAAAGRRTRRRAEGYSSKPPRRYRTHFFRRRFRLNPKKALPPPPRVTRRGAIGIQFQVFCISTNPLRLRSRSIWVSFAVGFEAHIQSRKSQSR